MKKLKLTIDDIFNLPGAVIYNPDSFKDISSVSIDSRNIKHNCLFIAIKGTRYDGHNFINGAIKNGASALLIDKKFLNKVNNDAITIITVPNTIKALGDIAKAWRSKLKAKVIGITGSSGKTTVKELIANVLSEKYKVNKTIANNNNHIGVPLTILSTKQTHQVLVTECGTNHFGEIKYIADILQPDYAIITNIGDSHLEFLKSRKGVMKEKSALFNAALKRGGKIFVNTDDPIINEFSKKVKNKINYGFNNRSDVEGKILSYDATGKSEVQVSYGTKKIKTVVNQPGEAGAKNFLAASAVGFEFGLTSKAIKSASIKIKSESNRVRIKVYKNFTILDDTYNANPDSMKSSLSILAIYKNRSRKIAVLGDMLELGKSAKKLHESLAEFIAAKNIHDVYTTGNMMKHLIDKLTKCNVTTKHFSNKKSLIRHLNKINLYNSVILVKGSRGMQMEEVVSALESRET